MKRSLLSLLVLGGILSLGEAHAVTWSTDGDAKSISTCSSGSLSNCKYTFSSLSTPLTVRAYSTPGNSGVSDGTYAPNNELSRGWIEAQMAYWSGSGLGVGNRASGDDYDCTSGSGCYPEHGVDNDESIDVVVYELPTPDWKVTSLGIGWKYGDSSTDVDIWVGGDANTSVDFRGVCFSGCSQSLASLGFTQLSSLVFNSTGIQAIPGQNQASATTGRFVVVAPGRADSNWEAFKLKNISAEYVEPTTPPDGQVPEPGALALLAGGLLALRFSRKLQAKR